MLDLIIIVLAFIAGLFISYLIFRQPLNAVERVVIAAGLGIGISVLAIFSAGGFSGVKELRYDTGLVAAIGVVVLSVEVALSKLQVVVR